MDIIDLLDEAIEAEEKGEEFENEDLLGAVLREAIAGTDIEERVRELYENRINQLKQD